MLNLIFDKVAKKKNFSKNYPICPLREHFRRYAHIIRFVVDLHGIKKFHANHVDKHYCNINDQLVINCKTAARHV